MLAIIAGASFMRSGAWALDKQGSAHGGAVEGPTTGFAVSGSVSVGVAPYNPSYAARPDNTGHAFMRYAAHLDIDLIGRRLSVPIDVNVLTDRDRGGARALLPTELDLITGLTSTWAVGPGALEVGTRVEHDRPVDRPGTAQSYVDVRARYLLASGDHFPSLRSALRDGGISGWATLGWFAYNTNYFARRTTRAWPCFVTSCTPSWRCGGADWRWESTSPSSRIAWRRTCCAPASWT